MPTRLWLHSNQSLLKDILYLKHFFFFPFYFKTFLSPFFLPVLKRSAKVLYIQI